MKTKSTLQLTMALAVVFSAWLGCSPERKPDPEMARFQRILKHSKEQTDAISKMCEAISLSLKATNFETRHYWTSNMTYWSGVSHEAYLKLKND